MKNSKVAREATRLRVARASGLVAPNVSVEAVRLVREQDLRTLARRINAKSRNSVYVIVRSTECAIFATHAEFHAEDETTSYPRVQLVHGPAKVGVVYDAEGWSVA